MTRSCETAVLFVNVHHCPAAPSSIMLVTLPCYIYIPGGFNIAHRKRARVVRGALGYVIHVEVVQSQSEKDMASASSFACAANFSAVGSRRSRAAAFSDDTTDEAVASTSRPRGQPSPDEQGVSTSSGETIVRNKGELIPPDPRRAMHMQAGGLGSSRVVPASEMLFCAGRDRRR